MSVCLENSNVLTTQVSSNSNTLTTTSPTTTSPVGDDTNSPTNDNNEVEQAAELQSAAVVPITTTTAATTVAVTTSASTLLQIPQSSAVRAIAKLPVAASTTNLPKTSVITVLNTPLGNVKTLCVTPAPSSNAAQFTVVNSSGTPINITNSSAVKSPTITLLNPPVKVLKSIPGSSNAEKNGGVASTAPGSELMSPAVALNENRGHNVFVKNTTTPVVEDGTTSSNVVVPTTHKIITANSFPNAPRFQLIDGTKTVNGQRNKVKIVSNVLVTPASHQTANVQSTSTTAAATTLASVTPTTAPNFVINKPNQRFLPPAQSTQQPRQKILPSNGAAKYGHKPLLNKTNIAHLKSSLSQAVGAGSAAPPPPPAPSQAQPQRLVYSTHKQLKTVAANNWTKPIGIKTLPPRPLAAGQFTARSHPPGLRTLPPQRHHKLISKANYISKHTIQPHKLKPPQNKFKALKPPLYNNYPIMQTEKQLTFNQALTAEILETLSNKTPTASNKNYEIVPSSRYDYYNHHPDSSTGSVGIKQYDAVKSCDDVKNKSGLDTLSMICHAVLLDHNYNATLPPDSPTRQVPPVQVQAQMNGNVVYSAGSTIKRPRTISQSNAVLSSAANSQISPPSMSTTSSPLVANSSNLTPLASTHHNHHHDDGDDGASDITDSSDRKHDTEEETDTAPEAEAVVNEDQFGDYVTRCICGFLHDDGYMIECDRCKVWQHVQCVVKNKQVPEEYLCEVCDPLKHVDRHKAKLMQQQWLRDRQLIDPKLHKNPKFNKELYKPHNLKNLTTDSDSSDIEHYNNNVVTTKGRPSLLNKRRGNNNDHHPTKHGRNLKDSLHQPRRQVKKREKRVIKRKTRQMISRISDDESGSAVVSSALSASAHLPQLRQWIENYEEAVTNHYSPELRARISSIRVNGSHSDLSIQQFDSSVHKCRVHTQPLTEIKYLVATVHLPPNTPVIELRGKYMLSTQHRNSGGNGCGGGSSSLTTRQHAQRPGPFLFFYRLLKDNTEVCVDTRTYGNSARFIRRSCKPNAELRHCIEKGVLHLYIVTIATVEKNIELTIKHESHDLAAIGTTHISCACGNSEECTVNKSTVKYNGDVENVHRKRRGRRTAAATAAAAAAVIATASPTATVTQPAVETAAAAAATTTQEDTTTTTTTEPIASTSTATTPVVTTTSPATEIDTENIKKEPEPTVKHELNDVDIQSDLDAIKAKVEEKPDIKQDITEEDVKEVEEVNDVKDVKDVKNVKDVKDVKDGKDGKDGKDSKDRKDGKDGKDVKDGKDGKDKKDGKDGKHGKDGKNGKDGKDEKPGRSQSNTSPQPGPSTRVATRRSSFKTDKDDHYDFKEEKRPCSPPKKMSREERKLEAILKAIDQMEKAHLKKQEHQAKQQNRRESEPGLTEKEDKPEPQKKRKKRKGRARTTSTTQQRRNRLNSTDSYLTSGDETLLSPGEHAPHLQPPLHPPHHQPLHPPPQPSALSASKSESTASSQDAGLLLSLASNAASTPAAGDRNKSPAREVDSTSNSVHSSPETQLSSACLLVQAAVEPMESSLKFPKTKKGLMNEWLNKVPDPVGAHVQPAAPQVPAASPSTDYENVSFYNPAGKNLAALAQVASFCDTNLQQQQSSQQARGSAKKRWLRQAMGEDQAESGASSGRPDSPPTLNDSIAPPKKRRLPRASLSNDNSPPSTPINLSNNSNVPEYTQTTPETETPETPPRPQPSNIGLLDPRLTRSEHHHDLFSSRSEQLLGTVEKTLSILGFNSGKKPETITPAKRKLSITEYRQRKKVNSDDKVEKTSEEPINIEDNSVSSESFKPVARQRSDSASSCASITSSDEEPPLSPILSFDHSATAMAKKAPAFNSEPTELERQREISNLRLKKAFGIPVNEDDAVTKAAVGLQLAAFLKGDVPIIDFRHSKLADKEEVVAGGSNSREGLAVGIPPPPTALPPPPPPPRVTVIEGADASNSNPYYTPDDEEEDAVHAGKEDQLGGDGYDETSTDYVPPFNNPIYPNEVGFSSYATDEDDEERYEGRNPSPPPNF